MQQRTISKSVTVTGIGLHSGKPVKLTLQPAEQNTGVVFQRMDIDHQPQIKADAYLINDTVMSTNLEQNGVTVSTVEHLLSAIVGLHIDNLLIQVSSSEVPIMDGSADDYVTLLQSAGIVEQSALRQFIKIKQIIRIEEGDKWVELQPFEGYQLNFEIDFNHPVINSTVQKASFTLSEDNYVKEIAKARTFGFMKDIEYLRSKGLALGGSLDNAVVVDETEIKNKEGLRFQDEFVKHKILDAIGDLSLIGYPLLAQYNAYKSGHALNNQLIRKVLSNPDSYEIVTKYLK